MSSVIHPNEALRTALNMVRETLGPPGVLPEEKWSGMDVLQEADLLVEGIKRIRVCGTSARAHTTR